jgi:hypothetical protein
MFKEQLVVRKDMVVNEIVRYYGDLVGEGGRSVSQHLILCKLWLYILPVWLNQLCRSKDGQNNLKTYLLWFLGFILSCAVGSRSPSGVSYVLYCHVHLMFYFIPRVLCFTLHCLFGLLSSSQRITTSDFVQIMIVHFARLVESTLQVKRWTEQSENILHGIK